MPQILQDLTFILIVAVLFTAPLYWISRPKKKRDEASGRSSLPGFSGMSKQKTPGTD
ncbi:hypothetical protein NJI34_44520 [Pseudomonas sp. S 311-6]|uniref:hypothetical protein n=1 Tax=Kerstersia gyiorum TaxID=206506 RepID=UPI0020977DB7|nr:hypothetical protein [Pseudomonas sp. S 311-6]